MPTREIYADSSSAINRLRNNKVLIDEGAKLVIVPNHGCGIKLWGAIDYLKRFHKWDVAREGKH